MVGDHGAEGRLKDGGGYGLQRGERSMGILIKLLSKLIKRVLTIRVLLLYWVIANFAYIEDFENRQVV